jgi:hypothetical protein
MIFFYKHGSHLALVRFGLAKHATGSTGVGNTAPTVNMSDVHSALGSTVTGLPRDILQDPITPPPPMTSLAQPRS